MSQLIKPNSTHLLAVINETGAPPQDNANHPSIHLSTDAFGNLLVAGVGGATSNVTVINGPAGSAVNVQDGGNVISVDDAGGSLTVDGAVTATIAEVDTAPTQIIKLVAATGTPEAVAVNGTFFKTALFIGNKAARTANTGKVWLGVTAGDGTQPIGLDAGAQRTIEAPEGQKYDLNDWYVDVETANDGVLVIYS